MQSPENPNLIQTPSPSAIKDQKKPQFLSIINQYTAETKVPSARDSYGNNTISGLYSPQDPTGLKLQHFSKAKQIYQSMQQPTHNHNSSRNYQATTAASFHKQTPSYDHNMTTLNSTLGGQIGYTPLRHQFSESPNEEDTSYRNTQESYIGGGGLGQRSDVLSPQINRQMLQSKQTVLSPTYLRNKQQSSPDAMNFMRQNQPFSGIGGENNMVQSKYISNNIPKQWVSEESEGLEDANPPYLENLNEHYFQIPQKQPYPERNTYESKFQEPYSRNKKENQDNIIEDEIYESQKRYLNSRNNQIPFLKGQGFIRNSDGQQQQVFYPLQSKHNPDLSKYLIPAQNLNKNQELQEQQQQKEKAFQSPEKGAKELAVSIENFQLNSYRPQDHQQQQEEEDNQNQNAFQQSFGKQQREALEQHQSQLDQVKDQLQKQAEQNLGILSQDKMKNPIYIPKRGRVIIKTKPGEIPSKITISNPPNPERDQFYARLAEEQKKILEQKQEQAKKKAELLSQTMEFINKRLQV